VQSIPPTAERIELLGAKGDVLFAIDVEQPDAPVPEGQQLSPTALLKLLIQAQEMALDRQSASIKGVMDGYATLAKMLAERLTSLERGYSQVLSAAFESTLMAAEAQAKLNGEQEKGENHSAIDQMAAEVIGKLMGGDKPPTVVQKKLDNGARVKPTSVVQKEV
jgi:hypothetical protein